MHTKLLDVNWITVLASVINFFPQACMVVLLLLLSIVNFLKNCAGLIISPFEIISYFKSLIT